MADTVHIVPHFHWDREWYFTAEESKILLVNDMEEVMDMLENREDYPYFVLDGQTAVLEDYFSVKPQNRERVKKLVQSGKLIIGPWYTQTDEMVVGGESIVRNLLYGLKDCGEFGPAMMIGYLPDSFGQSARMPQILRGFGIGRSMFWRGTSERHGSSKTEFLWRDDEGSEVTVQLLPLGYAIGKYLPTEKNALADRMSKYFPVLDRGATTEHILCPNGHDQMPVQKNIFDVMDSLRELYPDRKFFLDRYENVFEEIEKNQSLDRLKGEFLDGKYMRVHRSIYSSRADLKSANTRIENKITNLLEPLASVAASLGLPYEHGLIEEIWKGLMKNHAHDSIGCCCSDKVHRIIRDRFFLAEERTDRLIDFYKRRIVDGMRCDRSLDKLTVFNLLPGEREGVFRAEVITKMKNFKLLRPEGGEADYTLIGAEVIDAGLIDRQIVHYGDYDPFVKYTILVRDTVPAMGFKTYLVTETEGIHEKTEAVCAEPVMENEFYRIRIGKNGTLTVLDKEKGLQMENVLLLEDGADDGDTYDYSGLAGETVLTSAGVEASVKVTDFGLKQEAQICYDMPVPADLESRKAGKLDSRLGVCLKVTLPAGSRTIGVKFTCDNQAKDHRVRLYVPCGMTENSVCDNQFGTIKRPAVDPAMEVWEKEHWSERPDPIYPFLSWVTSKEGAGLSVITDSVREYEIIGEDRDTLAVTMFRCVGFLGKEEMLRRPGRPSGIRMETPDSQMQGRCEFDFFITTEKEDLPQVAKEALTPLITYNKMPYNAMKLNPSGIEIPYSYSFLEEKSGLILSVLKEAESGEGLIARFYNPKDTACVLEISVRAGDTKDSSSVLENGRIFETDLNEKILGETEALRQVLPNQIRTLLISRQ